MTSGLFRRENVLFFGFVIVSILLVSFFRVIFGPALFALIMTYLLNPFVSRFERHGVPRAVSTIGVLLSLIVGFVVLVIWVGPILYDQLSALVSELPRFREFVENRWLAPLNQFMDRTFGDAMNQIPDFHIRDFMPSLLRQALDHMLENLTAQTLNVFTAILLVILTPLLTFFFLRDLVRMERFILSLVPRDMRRGLVMLVREINQTLRSVIRGQLVLISIVSVLYSSAFAFSGMRFGIAVGFVTGLVRLVPSMDVLIGGSLSVLVLATYSAPVEVIVSVMLSFLAIQMLDIFVLTPRIMGQFSGLHPFLIILSVICFADWMGFYGVLLAIPMAATLRVLIRVVIREYRGSAFFRGGVPVSGLMGRQGHDV